MRKKRLIIDSDVANGVDDQFAICYAFARQELFDIKAITIEPFRVSWKNTLEIREGIVDSKNAAYHILHLFKIKYDKDNPFVYLGCTDFISNGYHDTNPAVEKIIKEAKSGVVYICCLGTLTNVAMALQICPEIAKNLRVVWLGTDNPLLDNFEDLNFSTDKQAFYKVLASGVDFTIIPSYVARTISTSTYEFAANIKNNAVTNYLSSLMQRGVLALDTRGNKQIHDLMPISYLLNPKDFVVKEISSKILDKDGALKKHRNVKYVASAPKNFQLWLKFLDTINNTKTSYLKPEIFFIADTHFGHEKKVRNKQVPFKTVEEMNKELIRRWNNKVGPNDIVYHVGDFGDYENIKYLNGKVYLICGNYENYDYKGKMPFKKFKEKLIGLGFADVYQHGIYIDEKIFGEKIFLTHKPTNHAKDCYTIFGHIHSLALVKPFGVNVCCTFHYYTPVDVKSLKHYLNFIKNFADEDAYA